MSRTHLLALVATALVATATPAHALTPPPALDTPWSATAQDTPTDPREEADTPQRPDDAAPVVREDTEPGPPDAPPPEEADAAGPYTTALRTRILEEAERRRRSRIVAMSTLLGWSGANMGVAAGGWALADDPEWVGFHQMSLAWNAINVAIAIPSLISAVRTDPSSFDLRDTMLDHRRTTTAFAFNTGLDVGWVSMGTALLLRGQLQDDRRLVGMGRSMMVHGGFLLVFDLVNWVVQGTWNKRFMATPIVGSAFGVAMQGSLGGPRTRPQP